jgi:hypothetical protein
MFPGSQHFGCRGALSNNFRASLLAHTFASPCFGHEPKAIVATHKFNLYPWIFIFTLSMVSKFFMHGLYDHDHTFQQWYGDLS